MKRTAEQRDALPALSVAAALAELQAVAQRVPREERDAFRAAAIEELHELKGGDWRRDVLNTIVGDLRAATKGDPGLGPGEAIRFPGRGEFAEYTAANSAHVDAFLYPTDDDIDDLCDAGKLSRNYCLDCKSRNVAPVNFLSHSFSVDELAFLFSDHVLGDLAGKTVVDVGSRLGAVLYAGHVFSKATLVGIEFAKPFCDMSAAMLDKYRMADRCKVIHADVRTQAETVGAADVLILHNVFEFFNSEQEQLPIWQWLRRNVTKKGTLIVAAPSIETCLDSAGIPASDLDLDKWVAELEIDPVEGDLDAEKFHLYEVN